jgi:uncharacterized membrane protein YfcA
MIPEIVTNHLGLIALSGILLGLDKGGLKPLSVLAMYFILKVFEPAMMLSIFAPLLLVGELYPAYYYRKSANRPVSNKLLVWMLVGLVLGTLVGTHINQAIFCILIGIFVIAMGVINIILERKEIKIKPTIAIIGILGSLAGFGSIIGNAAGGITNIYFLSQTKNKRELLGSSSYLYIIVNSAKLLLYIFIWKIFSTDTIVITISLVPFLLIGVILATAIIKIMPEVVFKAIFYFSVFYAGLSLLIGNL